MFPVCLLQGLSLFVMIATGAARRACSPGTMQHSSGRAVMDMDIPITLMTICGQHCPERWHLACSTAQHATRTQIRRWCTRFAALAVVAPHGRPPRAAPRETRCSGPRRKSSRPQATTRREVYSPKSRGGRSGGSIHFHRLLYNYISGGPTAHAPAHKFPVIPRGGCTQR